MAGRPSKYDAELQAKADYYVENFDDHIEIGDRLPTIEGLALYLNLHRDTIYVWSKDSDKPEFSDTIENLMQKQKKLLFEYGLTGTFAATIVKLGLSANHGMNEKQERELSGSLDMSGMTDAELLQRLDELRSQA